IPNLSDWQEQAHVFEEVATFDSTNFVLTGVNEAERITGSRISSNLFPLLRLNPLHGRAFSPEDEQPGHGDVVLVSYELWQSRFGAAPDLIGRTLKLDDKTYTVVGIMPRGFSFPKWLEPADAKNFAKAELWTPLTI